ncbi:MAG: hypothetical protein K5849_01030 [Bacteroidales bacterium]|nr:hypothetical protein [Bacteroidales bacterium]
MRQPVLYTLTSGLHGEMAPDARQEPFIQSIEAALGCPFDARGEDLAGFGQEELELIYVRTGGTEGFFLERVGQILPHLSTPKDILLLTSGQSNSLAASMEILSWLRQHGYAGEILHGSAERIAGRIRAFAESEADATSPAPAADLTEPVGPETFGRILAGKRYGVIGKPSDWLISSGVDQVLVRENLGAELVDIPIEELVAEARQGGPLTAPALKPLNRPRYGNKIDRGDWDGAMDIYGALKRLVGRYRLDGLTLRCFDLLTALHNTGCLALAILNAEGITATCEGDIPAMLSMAVAQARTGRASFQVNLSRIEGDRLLFAHCTVPLSLVRDYCYDTHFESGIGVAIHGELPEGPVTVFKLSPDGRRMFRREARLTANTYDDRLCRTQVIVEAPGAAEYFLRTPVGNHHILIPGKL